MDNAPQVSQETALQDPAQMAAQLDAARTTLPDVPKTNFMRLNQERTKGIDPALVGHITYGPDQIAVQPTDQWIILLDRCGHGYVQRDGSRVLRERYGPLTTPLLPLAELPAPDTATAKWGYAYRLELMQNVEGGPVCVLSGDQQGFVEGVKHTLLGAIINRVNELPQGDNSYWPVVTLDVSSYDGKNGRIYKPVIKVIGWTPPFDSGQPAPDFGMGQVQEPQPAPATVPVQQAPAPAPAADVAPVPQPAQQPAPTAPAPVAADPAPQTAPVDPAPQEAPAAEAAQQPTEQPQRTRTRVKYTPAG